MYTGSKHTREFAWANLVAATELGGLLLLSTGTRGKVAAARGSANENLLLLAAEAVSGVRFGASFAQACDLVEVVAAATHNGTAAQPGESIAAELAVLDERIENIESELATE